MKQIERRACQNVQRLSQTTLLAMLEDTRSGDFLAGIPIDTWTVVSFNPIKREACVEVTPHDIDAEVNARLVELRAALATAADETERLLIESEIRSEERKLTNPITQTLAFILPDWKPNFN